MGPRIRKVLHDLRAQKSRTILVILSIAVGVIAVGTLLQTHVIVAAEMNKSYAAINPAHVAITTDPFEEELVNTVRRMKSVADAEGRRSVLVRLNVGEDEWVNLQLIAIDDFDEMAINLVNPETGAWPAPKQSVLIERGSVDFVQHVEEESLLVETAGGLQRELRFAGTVHDANKTSAMMVGTGYGFITFETLEWLGEPRNFNELYVTVVGEPSVVADVQPIAEDVQTAVEKSGRTVYSTFIPTPNRHPFDEFFQPIAYILDVIGFLALGLSGLLVVNTITALLAQQIKEIGVMKAVGARSWQITGLYFFMVTLFGLMALIIAVPLATFGARMAIDTLTGFFNLTVTSYDSPLWILLVEMALGLLVPLLAALYPIWSGSKITVREAVNSYGLPQDQMKGGLVDKLVSRLQRLPRPFTLSIRNTFRQRSRLTLTLTTLTLGGAIFMGVYSTRASLQSTFGVLFDYWQYDVAIELNRHYRIPQLEQVALGVPGVEDVEAWGKTFTRRQRDDESESDVIQLFAPPAETEMIAPVLLNGRWLSADDTDAIVVNTSLVKDEPDVEIGKTITLNIEGRETEWLVVGVVKGLPFSSAMAYVNYDHFAYVIRDIDSANLLQVVTTQHDSATQNEMARLLDNQFKSNGLSIGSVTSTANERLRISLQLDFIVAFLMIVSLGLGAVGGIGLMGAMGISVIERRKEIGVMRAIGASDKAVLKIVVSEGIFIGVLSWAIGAVLALPLGMLLSNGLGVILTETPLDYEFSTAGVVIWLVLVTLIAAFASYFPARTASQVTIREVLAYE